MGGSGVPLSCRSKRLVPGIAAARRPGLARTCFLPHWGRWARWSSPPSGPSSLGLDPRDNGVVGGPTGASPLARGARVAAPVSIPATPVAGVELERISQSGLPPPCGEGSRVGGDRGLGVLGAPPTTLRVVPPPQGEGATTAGLRGVQVLRFMVSLR